MVSLTSFPVLCGTAEAALAPLGMLYVPGWGCFPQENCGFTEVACGHLGAAKLFPAHHGCLVPLLSPSKERINNQKMRQKWRMDGSWHLNVIRNMRHGRVKVSSCPCVYCCLHIDLFPDTSAMTWKEFILLQILHRTSMWPLGLNKGKSTSLLLWWPWQSHDEECRCCQPCTGWWHRQHSLAWSHHDGGSACAPTLPAPCQAAPWTGLCQVDGASEDTMSPSRVCQN